MSYFEFPHTRTYDSDLGWLIKTVKELTDLVAGLEEWKTQYEEAYNQLMAIYDSILSGNFPESIQEAFGRWMREHGESIIAEMIKMVFFGISNDGYFVAFIPDSWNDITFGTSGLDDFPAGIEYGHLTLTY